jgi:hypothetical protein
MEKTVPRFVRHNGVGGPRVTFITLTYDGKLKELNMWEMVDKYGADGVLKMRAQYPEFEVEE